MSEHQEKFYGVVPFLLVQELVKGLLGEDIFELLVGLRNYPCNMLNKSPLPPP